MSRSDALAHCRTAAEGCTALDRGAKRPHNPLMLELLLDNLRSVFNVGSIFRTSDGAGVRHVHLCGITPTPQQAKLAKTALGTERSISWSYEPNSLSKARELQRQGKVLWSLETTSDSQSIFTVPHETIVKVQEEESSIVLVVGNELAGVDPELQAQADKRVHLPMVGRKESLNVAVATGIALYHLRFCAALKETSVE